VADEPGMAGLEAERARLYAELSGVGDFRRGALSAVFRKCGKPKVHRSHTFTRSVPRTGLSSGPAR
jgi:hypothetical protein